MQKREFPLRSDRTLRLAMIGMVDGNGHPYSWSALFNGYNRDAMALCPYAGIPAYLAQEPPETLPITGAQVTHIWTDDPADAEKVAEAACVPHILKQPEDCIDRVDAVIIATDIGAEHVARCRPFVEAGLPVFVDKPLVDNEEDLRTFKAWVDEGHPIMSSSCMRYAKEYQPLRISTRDLGQLRYLTTGTHKTWDRYGIHALEAIYPILGPGFEQVRHSGGGGRDVMHLTHRSGADVVLISSVDMIGGFGSLMVCGTTGRTFMQFSDTFHAFKSQLEAFVQYLQTGIRPFPFAETVELMQLVIAGIRSRAENGRTVPLTEISA